MILLWMSHVTHMNESCHTRREELGPRGHCMSLICMSLFTHAGKNWDHEGIAYFLSQIDEVKILKCQLATKSTLCNDCNAEFLAFCKGQVRWDQLKWVRGLYHEIGNSQMSACYQIYRIQWLICWLFEIFLKDKSGEIDRNEFVD